MNWLQKRAAAIKAAQEILTKVRGEGRGLTDAEQAELDRHLAVKAEADRIEGAEREHANILGVPRDEAGTGNNKRLNFKGQQAANVVIARAGMRGGGVKALLEAGSAARVPTDEGEIVADGRPAGSIFQLVEAKKLDEGSAFSYLRQSARTNNAAPVAKGAPKPVSTYRVERIESKLEVVAHVVEGLDKYDLADNDALGTFVKDEMMYGLQEAVADQLVNGTGVSPSLAGILNTPGVRSQAPAVSPLVTIRRALGQLEDAGYVPSAILLNSTDWQDVETLQTTGGAFVLGNATSGAPLDAVERRAWGTRVGLSSAIVPGTAIVLSEGAVRIRHDGNVTLEFDPYTRFGTNEINARAEGRFQSEIRRPDGIVVAELA